MDELQIFENKEFGKVRTVVKGGEPWFVASDVCESLGLSNPTVSVNRLDADERSKFNLGRQGEVNTVNEYGLYNLVLGSRKPEAKAFKRWITHEVIPTIRKHGGYLTPDKVEEILTNPDAIIRLATQLKEERAKREAAKILGCSGATVRKMIRTGQLLSMTVGGSTIYRIPRSELERMVSEKEATG